MQYAAAFDSIIPLLWNTGSPAFADDDTESVEHSWTMNSRDYIQTALRFCRHMSAISPHVLEFCFEPFASKFRRRRECRALRRAAASDAK
jgi:hypothetical protein